MSTKKQTEPEADSSFISADHLSPLAEDRRVAAEPVPQPADPVR